MQKLTLARRMRPVSFDSRKTPAACPASASSCTKRFRGGRTGAGLFKCSAHQDLFHLSGRTRSEPARKARAASCPAVLQMRYPRGASGGVAWRHAGCNALPPSCPTNLGKCFVQLGCLEDAVIISQLRAIVGQPHLAHSLRGGEQTGGKGGRARALQSRPSPQVPRRPHAARRRPNVPGRAHPIRAHPRVLCRRLRTDVRVPFGGERAQAGQRVQRGLAHPAALAALQLVQLAAGGGPGAGL